jgi:predicted TIM-barrel enzyme
MTASTQTRLDGSLLERMQAARSAGRPILGAGTGTGLVAKAAATAGPDFIVVYCTSRARNRGFPTSIIGDPNGITLELLPDVIRVAGDVPVVAGIQATDPTRDMDELLLHYERLGCAGVINYPSSGLYGTEYIGGPYSYADGLEVEARVLGRARSRGLVTMTYVYRPSEAAVLMPSCDVVVAHAGWTSGGLDGAPDAASYEDGASLVQEQLDASLAVAPDAIALAHGGPFSGPDDVRRLYELTTAEGFVGASSIERIPVERGVADAVRAFLEVPFAKGGAR